MVNVINFSESFEEGMKELGAEVRATQAASGETGAPPREVVRKSIESLASRIEAAVPAPPPPPLPREPASSLPPAPPHADDLPSYLTAGDVSDDVRDEVDRLVHLVFQHGIVRALGSAKRHSAFVQDAFHDALTDKLLPELLRRGIIRSER